MELIEILRCPRTGNRLRFDDGDSVVRVEDSDVTYPNVDGIVRCPRLMGRLIWPVAEQCSAVVSNANVT